MTNTQPVEKLVEDDGTSLDVIEVFPTIQGEGPFAGTPAVFIRLAGCNLQCPACDTNYTKGRNKLPITEIIQRILDCRGKSKLVVITGGEPLRQNIKPFTEELMKLRIDVQIESNGTLFRKEMHWTYGWICIICSPKTPKLDERLLPYITAYKYIVEDGKVDANDGLPLNSLGMSGKPARPHKGFSGQVYVQPMDAGDPIKNKANMRAAVVSCMMYGYILSLQMHKICDLP